MYLVIKATLDDVSVICRTNDRNFMAGFMKGLTSLNSNKITGRVNSCGDLMYTLTNEDGEKVLFTVCEY